MLNKNEIDEKHIRKLMKEKRFDEVCNSIAGISNKDFSVEILLNKATAIQLANDSSNFTLDDARESLVEASRIEPFSAEALVDLGHFYFAIDDNPRDALICFERAGALLRKLYEDYLIGKAKALFEVEGKLKALAVLQSFDGLSDSLALKVLENDFKGE